MCGQGSGCSPSCPPFRLQLNELVCLPAACQRVFFGKSNNAAETVWAICQQGECSPNRQFVAEPFEDVMRSGKCSEVCIRNTVVPAVPAAALDVVRAALDARVHEEREENEDLHKKRLLRKFNPIRYAELYGNEAIRPKERFDLRTIYFQRVCMRADPGSGSNAAMRKLVEVLEHEMGLVVTLIFCGCDFDDDSMGRLVEYLKVEPRLDDESVPWHLMRASARVGASPSKEDLQDAEKELQTDKKTQEGCEDEEALAVANPLQKRRGKGIRVLWLRRAGLTSRLLDCLARGLQDNQNLMQLDLAQNPLIGDEGAGMLAKALKSHPSIWHIGLQDCKVRSAGIA